MVLLVSCYSQPSNLESQDDPSELYEVKTSPCGVLRSQPLPFCEDEPATMDRYPQLSSSVESINSIRSSRSSMEREVERAQKRHLLDVGLSKLRQSGSMPLRKHLLVYQSVKQLQRDLDMLDDEDVYCSLLWGSETGENQEEEGWERAPGAPRSVPVSEDLNCAPVDAAPSIAPSTTAPTVLSSVSETTSVCTEPVDSWTGAWAWCMPNTQQQPDLFQSISSAVSSVDGGSYNSRPSSPSASSGGLGGWRWSATSAWIGALPETAVDEPMDVDPLDPWGASLSRFELQHLFPSQVLLQA